jgi:hypothetical protein
MYVKKVSYSCETPPTLSLVNKPKPCHVPLSKMLSVSIRKRQRRTMSNREPFPAFKRRRRRFQHLPNKVTPPYQHLNTSHHPNRNGGRRTGRGAWRGREKGLTINLLDILLRFISWSSFKKFNKVFNVRLHCSFGREVFEFVPGVPVFLLV